MIEWNKMDHLEISLQHSIVGIFAIPIVLSASNIYKESQSNCYYS